MRAHLSVKDAAKRVRRSKRTIERWIAEGLFDLVVVKDDKGEVIRRYIPVDQLLAVYRKKIVTNPTRKRPRHDDTPP